MYRKLLCVVCFSLVGMATSAEADALKGFSDITVVNSAVASLRYAGAEYVVANGDLMLGTTTRWYIPAATGVPTLWREGDPAPAATVPGTSDPKAGDVGSNADDWIFAVSGAVDGISSSRVFTLLK
jgi:hypothetical protein